MTDTNANIADVLWQQALNSPMSTAVRDLSSDDECTYTQLQDRVARVGGAFVELGLVPGDRVALLMTNSCAYVDAFYGAIAAGLVVVPLNTRLTTTDFAHMLADAQCSAIVTEQPFLGSLIADPQVTLPFVIDATHGVPSEHTSLNDLATGSRALSGPVNRDASDICSLMYTSGTTGLPKAVMLPHRSWSAVAETSLDVLGFESGIRVMHPAPLTHGAGFMMLPTLMAGGVNVMTRSFDPRWTADLIAEGEVDALFLVPSMIRMLLDTLPAEWAAPPTFRWVYYAGSPVTADTLREATRRFDGRLVQSFAQMEAPMFITTLSSGDHIAALGDSTSDLVRSAGRVMSGCAVRIVDDGSPVDNPYAIGEIHAKAPQTMAGYWNRTVASKEVLTEDGWLKTGDLGYLDPSGYLFIVDRLKDMIVTGGSNVYASEVEDAINQIDGVASSAVIGLPHRLWGEEVTAVVVPDPEANLRPDLIREQCRVRLAGYKVPKRVVFVDELPTNPYGKVLKRALRKQVSVLFDEAS